jgi:hypothetical protein
MRKPWLLWTPAGGAVMQTPYLEEFVAVLKAEVPASCRWWNPAAKCWQVEPSYADLACRLFEGFFPREAAGFPAVALVPAWARILHVQPDAPLCVAEAAYRALAHVHHPDRGGDLERCKQLNLVIETARAVLPNGSHGKAVF